MGSEDKTILEYATATPWWMWRPSRRFIFGSAGAGFIALVFCLWYASIQVAASRSANCAANMRSVGQMLVLYGINNGAGPPSLPVLLDYVWLKGPRPYDSVAPPRTTNDRLGLNSVCVCPTLHSPQAARFVRTFDYVLTPAAAQFYRLKPNTILLYETACRHNGRMNVLFADGSVRSISAAESQAMLADLNAGKNPPPSLQSKVGR